MPLSNLLLSSIYLICFCSLCVSFENVKQLFSTFKGRNFEQLSGHEKDSMWENFNKVHDYRLSREDKDTLMKNLKHCLDHNIKFDSSKSFFSKGLHKYSHLTTKQMKTQLTGLRQLNGQQMNERLSSKAFTHQSPTHVNHIPSSVSENDISLNVDWRRRHVVTPVKDQGQCGSCYTFSATGALEGMYARATGKLVSFSEQQLVECSSAYGNQGCFGGLMDNCFEYIHDIEGIEKEDDYPYHPMVDECRYNKSLVVTTLDSIGNIDKGNEDDLMDAVYRVGPISVAIDATSDFMGYSSGVFYDDSCSSENLNHGVLLVGYGVERIGTQRHPYWLVKNSWSSSWGDEGYIKMARNQSNMCGIASFASYPILKSPRL